ncbi:MAG: transcription-repair coupling factor [Sphaerochaetaceae bacterium]|jgi:transcription-repair coupling factor (superfamily II helicase)|nr:transcription-repair coupling factor [Sphaerochaetaceae bacterium]NLO61507.1 transcription-repair coupling factor [Spirochaetales bacterium]MDD2404887.1 transcription-repair coupling factor [Sphaerochaetaceae bacterium]MDD3670940.1 transcription-repair coupling factor [Sphaerochaetaceae bacterium]MDD4260481.1 transcription-repair coupling factor [Sphaerochaetaceae bacterium]
MQTLIGPRVQSYLKNSDAYKAFKLNSTKRWYVEGLEGFPLAQAVLLYSRNLAGRIWVICPTEDSAAALFKDIAASGALCQLLPSSGKQLYSEWEGTHREYEQLKVLGIITEEPKTIVITSLRAFVSPMVDISALRATAVELKVNDRFDPASIAERLAGGGYFRSPSTTMPGEFSIHGEVFDVFGFDADYPARIYADWDKIDKISLFDPLTQDTMKTLGHLKVRVLADSESIPTGLIDGYFNQQDYCFFVGKERLSTSFNSLMVEARSLYRSAFTLDRSVKKPNELLYDFPDFLERQQRCTIVLELRGQHPEAFKYDITGPRSYFGNFVMLKEELTQLERNGYRVTIFAGGEVQRTRLASMLNKFESLDIVPFEISAGFSILSERVVAMCDHEIFGRRKIIAKTLHKVQTSPLDSFVDLNEGDYVVHVNYGIGQFLKIDRVSVSGKERDYIKIQYAQEETLYVPIEQANLIQRYIGSEGSAPKLDRLGGQGWEHKKAKARKSAEELAARLIQLYARRKSSKGFPFPKDTDWQLEFEASFPFEETEDQLTCIDDIKRDMESPVVMDRLVCGDVGYGKTEIALRAAFKAVMAGKQVAFLAPTTILAEQHHDTLVQRLGQFPVKTAVLSRMVAKKEQREILKKVSQGSIDILVGTHRILQKDIVFKELGLLIIDEEQRFGVKDKERVKELKNNIDSIALSATPIPRTLYMSLLKIRDMSLLTTPPVQRRPIKTIIKEYDLGQVEAAIKFELARNGQVFYLHNRIDTLDQVVSMLSQQMPHIIVESIHGQMNSEVIEDTMRRFVHQGIQVLVSTTIIENGIDIPNVNTIIIDRADLYGVSQLYQLRGRVGRSDQEAYAYLFYPELRVLSEIAVKRLKVISEHTELGSGFKIAMKDMEIRGTGNLLGKEQSGQLASVGLDMYLRILDEAIATLLKEGDQGEDREVFLELDYSGFIPDSYIAEPSVKFDVYKKIASIQTDAQLQAHTSEMEDRFGPMPEVVSNLLYIAELKIICKKLSIYHLKERNGKVLVEFSKVKDIAIDKLMELIRLGNGSVSIDPRKINVVTFKTDAISLKDKSLFILEKLQRLI